MDLSSLVWWLVLQLLCTGVVLKRVLGGRSRGGGGGGGLNKLNGQHTTTNTSKYHEEGKEDIETVEACLDRTLFILLYIIISLISLSVCLDLIPGNAVSDLYLTDIDYIKSSDCSAIIRCAEAHAKLKGGWLQHRHKFYPTTDLSAYTINQTIMPISRNGDSIDFLEFMNSTVDIRILPLMGALYDLPPEALYMQDLFIVKYDATLPDTQRALQVHTDSSLMTFSIALSRPLPPGLDPNPNPNPDPDPNPNPDLYPNEGYQGGGTKFILSDEIVRGGQGSILFHPSRVYHAGEETTKGVRYLAVGFVQVKDPYFRLKTFWRRFGALTKCLQLSVLSKEIIDRITVDKVGKLEFIDLITADKFGKLSSSRKEEGPSFIQALLDGGTEGWTDDGVGANSNSNPNPNLEGVVSTQYCRSWGWVFAYEGYALYKVIFLESSPSTLNTGLKWVLGGSFLALAWLVYSLISTSSCCGLQGGPSTGPGRDIKYL